MGKHIKTEMDQSTEQLVIHKTVRGHGRHRAIFDAVYDAKNRQGTSTGKHRSYNH